jgi:hypothetical protein
MKPEVISIAGGYVQAVTDHVIQITGTGDLIGDSSVLGIRPHGLELPIVNSQERTEWIFSRYLSELAS